jgi:SET domain-containing protein
MLLIPVRVAPSSIHGLGAFAVEDLAAGTPVWRFTPGFDLDLDPDVLDEQPPHFAEVLLHYGWIDPRLGRFILACDDARFLNHSETPNLVTEFGSDLYGVDRATRDIAQGEELTLDYRVVERSRPP